MQLYLFIIHRVDKNISKKILRKDEVKITEDVVNQKEPSCEHSIEINIFAQ